MSKTNKETTHYTLTENKIHQDIFNHTHLWHGIKWPFSELCSDDKLSYQHLQGIIFNHIECDDNDADYKIICVTSPYTTADFEKHFDEGDVLHYRFRKAVYFQYKRLTFYNCGQSQHRALVKSTVETCDKVFPEVTRYKLYVDDASPFKRHDIVSLHNSVTNEYGVLEGVDPNNSMPLMVISTDRDENGQFVECYSNHRLNLMCKDLLLTKGIHIQPTIFYREDTWEPLIIVFSVEDSK